MTKNGNFNVSQSKSEIRKGPTSENQVCACWLPCRFLRENTWTNLHCLEKRKKKRRTKRDQFCLIDICCVNTLSDQPKTAVMRDHTHVCFSLNRRWCQQHCAKRPNKNAKESALQLVALSQRWKADRHSQFFKQKKTKHTNNIRGRQQPPQQQQ